MSSTLIDAGMAALREGNAAAARRAFELALIEVESGTALEGLGEALYLERDYLASAAHYERAYSAYRMRTPAHGRGPGGADARLDHGERPRRLGRPERMAGASPDAARGGGRRMGPSTAGCRSSGRSRNRTRRVRESVLREAIAIGRRFGDPDIEFLGMAYLGSLYVMIDRVEEGLVLSDEALAALCAGELTELATVDEIVLRALLGVRARQRRGPGRPVDARGRRAHAAEQRRRPPSAAPTTAAS